MDSARRVSAWLAVAAVGLAAPAVWAQDEAPPRIEPLGIQELRIFQRAQASPIAPFMVTPSLLVTEEYNDNVLLTNQNRQRDWITGITPALGVVIEQPRYRLTADASFTATFFARETDRNEVFDRQSFTLGGSYRVDPRLGLSISDGFILSRDTNLVTTQGVATGRSLSWSNVLTPGLSWQMTQRTALQLTTAYALQRFERRDLNDSDVYRVAPTLEHRLTERLTGTLAYQFAYFDIQRTDTTLTHTSRVGARYRLTETLIANVSGGITVETDGRSRTSPAASADLTQRTSWGQVGVFYDRSVGTSAGLGGATDNQVAGATVGVALLSTGLRLDLSPRYATTESRDGSIDVRTISASIRALYQFNQWIGLFGSYAFFHQRSESSPVGAGGTPLSTDVDQNRVSLGLRFGYPFLFY